MNEKHVKEAASRISDELRTFVWCATDEAEKLTAEHDEGNYDGSEDYWRMRSNTDRTVEKLVEAFFDQIFEEMQRRLGG